MKKNGRKATKKIIRKAANAVSSLPASPQTGTYVKLYEAMEELYFQGAYKLASGIGNAVLENTGTNGISKTSGQLSDEEIRCVRKVIKECTTD